MHQSSYPARQRLYFDGRTLSCSDAAKSPSDTGCQHLLRLLRREKKKELEDHGCPACRELGSQDRECLTVPRRQEINRDQLCSSRLRVSRLTDAKLRTPRRLDVAGDRKGDCTRFIRCRLSVTEVNNMPNFFFFFLVRSVMQRVLPQPKKKPVRTLGNHVHSAGVHEKRNQGKGKKKRKERKKKKEGKFLTQNLFHPNRTSCCWVFVASQPRSPTPKPSGPWWLIMIEPRSQSPQVMDAVRSSDSYLGSKGAVERRSKHLGDLLQKLPALTAGKECGCILRRHENRKL